MADFSNGVASPSRTHPWGAVPIDERTGASLSRAMWFDSRAQAVTYAKKEFGRCYAIARGWFDGQDPNEHK